MSNHFHAGFGREDITPPVGEFCSMRRAPGKRSRGLHDPLYAHAVSLTNGAQKLMLISADAIQIPERVVLRIKEGIRGFAKLTHAEILVAATHSHNTPEILGDDFADHSKQVDRLVEKTILAAQQSYKNLFDARIAWGHCEVGNPRNRFQNRIGGDLDRVDKRVDFLRIEDAEGNYRGMLWHLAGHPTTAMSNANSTFDDHAVSADYCGVANREIMSQLGGFSVFFQGACGNVNLELGPERTFEKAESHGRSIAARILAKIGDLKTVAAGPLDSRETTVESPITSRTVTCPPDPNPEEVFEYYRNLPEMKVDPGHVREAFIEGGQMRRRAQVIRLFQEFIEPNRSTETVTVHAHRILDHLIVTAPGEIFIEFQFDLQETFEDYRAMIFGYANGHIGYIPDPESFEIETYETIPTYMKRAGKEAGTRMMDAGKKMLRKILAQG